MSGNFSADQSSSVTVIRGLTVTKSASIAGQRNIHDNRENKDGPLELPKSLQQADATPSRTVLQFENFQVGDDAMLTIGEKNSYFDNTKSSGDVSGARQSLDSQATPMDTDDN